METAVVLGATEGLGKAVVDRLVTRNIHTKILVKNIEKYKSLYPDGFPGEINAIEGDLDNNQALAKVCEYADTIFLCFNPAYTNWRENMTRWIDKIADLGAALGARLLFPGNVYNFGHVDVSDNPINEEHPNMAHTEKGQLRIAIEKRLTRAAMDGAALTILRFPDMYGPAVFDNLIYQVFKSALQDNKCQWYGNPDKLHDFIYTKDAGEAMVRAALEPRAADTALHVPGPNPISSKEWINKVYDLAGSDLNNPIKLVSKLKLTLSGIINKDARELRELYYLFEEPLILDGTKFNQIVGELDLTPHGKAIKESLEWYRSWIDNS